MNQRLTAVQEGASRRTLQLRLGAPPKETQRVMAKTILMIHGRDFKPPRKSLERLWHDALRFAIQRDAPNQVGAFDRATKQFAYYGDLSKRFLVDRAKRTYVNDIKQRRATLEALKAWRAKDFCAEVYASLPEVSRWREALAWMLGDACGTVALAERLIEWIAPDLREYWNHETQFGSDVRAVLAGPLRDAMDRGDDILVLSHSLGAMVAYDTFWKFSHYGEYRPYWKKKIALWITCGSPLADETIKGHLKGATIQGRRRYPANIRRWANFTAEDDYVCHDARVADDYADMLEWKLTRAITDQRIHNLAVCDGKSNPHHGVGYLVHPTVVREITRWLRR